MSEPAAKFDAAKGPPGPEELVVSVGPVAEPDPAWDEVLPASEPDDGLPPLDAAGIAARDAVAELLRPRLGNATFQHWLWRADCGLRFHLFFSRPWERATSEGELRHHAWRTYLAVRNHLGAKPLQAEWIDERFRQAARDGGDEQIVALLSYFRRRLGKAQKRNWRQWVLPGVTAEEFQDLAEIEVLRVLRANEFAAFEKPGVPATLRVASALRRELRRRRDVFLLPTTPEDVELLKPEELARDPDQERDLFAQEWSHAVSRALAALESECSRIQRRWLEEIRNNVGATGNLNMSSVADALGKNRSSGARMRAEFVSILRRELRRDGWDL